ncbi:MAG: PAS domain S-box protein [Chitinophagaceae bacterium]|nr:PAS domain S-box protein [Chitinophagaceae bacterium]
MKPILSKRLTYLAFIVPFIALLIVFIFQYRSLKRISNQAKDTKGMLILVKHLDKFRSAYNDILYNEKPLLIFKYKNRVGDYEIACHKAKEQIDSLQLLCAKTVIPCANIAQLNTLFSRGLVLSDTIIALSKRGQLDSAAALLNSKEHDLARVATINTFSGIAGEVNRILQVIQEKDDREVKKEYQLLGLISIETFLFLGFIFWRMRLQLVTRNQMLKHLKIFESTTDGVIVTDGIYNITYFNKTISGLIGFESRQISGSNVFDRLAGIGCEKCKKLIVDGLVNQKANSIDFLYTNTKRWYRVTVFPIPEGYTFYVKNVSDLKKAEIQLKKITQAIEQNSSSVVITDIKGHIEYVNPAFTKLTGYTFEEAIGQTPRILRSGKTPSTNYYNLWQNITHLKEWRGELLNKKKNGETYWEYTIISPIVNDEGELINFLAVKENITERKRLEEEQKQLLEIIENTTAYVGTCDMNLNLIYGNKALRDVLEIGNNDISKYNIASFRTEQAKKMDAEVTKSVEETGRWIGENSYVSKSGKVIPVLQVIVLHKDADGEVSHISSTSIDITRDKEAEKEMSRLNNELREFSRHLQYIRETEKNKIAKEVHDELGQGLAAIKFDVSWLKKHLGDDREVLEQKTDEILKSISEKLIAFRKIYAAANTTMLEELGLHASVVHLIDLFTKSSFIPVKFSTNIQEVKIKSTQSLALYRVLEECISNIVRYAGATQVSISLLKQGNSLVMQIEDNGNGFDIAMVDPKLQHGILSMRERVYSLDGVFNITSVVGEGTKISIEVPI